MIRTSFCTIGFQKNKWGADKTIERPLTSILPILAEARFDGVEIWADHWLMASPAEQETILRQLRDLKLSVAMISSYYNFTTSDDTAQESMQTAARVLDAARLLNSRGIRLFTGKTASKDATPDQWNRCARCLADLCDRSASDGILWCLETHSWNLMDTVEGTLKLIGLVNRPNLKVIYQPSTFGADYLSPIAPLAPHIAHVHANNKRDNKGCLLRDGELNYDQVLAGLRRISFKGYISIEWFGEDPERIARSEGPWLKQWLGR